VTNAATNCVQEQGSTTVYPSLVQAQPGFSGGVQNPQPAWPTGLNLGCDTTLVANGSGTGKTALINYYVNNNATVVDMAASSAPLAAGAEQTNLMAFQVGGDAMVIAVKATDGISQITMGDVYNIWNGNFTTWDQLSNPGTMTGPLVARSRIVGSGTRDDMNRLFKVDRGVNNSGPACSAGFSSCEPTMVAATGLPRLTTSQDEADAACNNANQIVYTSLANLAAFGPSGTGCLKALSLQACTFGASAPFTPGACSGSFVAPSVASVSNSTYPARRQLFITLPKPSVAAAKFGTGNGTGWTDNLGLTKAMDIVNYMESTQGQNAMGAVNFVQITVPAKPPIPDADIDLNGGIGLTDIGQITGRWNHTDTISGSVRADVNNDGGVGLLDIGKITGQWGATGFIAP
jgi:ABC-type phosphate transport system substrate-binding protein